MTTNFEDLASLRLLDEVRSRLAQRASTETDSLGEPHDAVVAERSESAADALTPMLAAIDLAGHALPAFPSASRIPGGSLLHRVAGRIVRRDTEVLATRLEQISAQTTAALGALAAHVDRQVTAIGTVRADDRAVMHRSLSRMDERHDALEDAVVETARRSDERTAALLRRQAEHAAATENIIRTSIDDVRSRMTELAADADELDRWVRDRGFRPWFSNASFADAFRGSREDVLQRYHDVADLLLEQGGPTIDLGCGRGELVELLVSKGGVARGVEYDGELVKYCREIFLDVEEGTAAAALEQSEDETFGGIALMQVVEHLTPQQLVDLIPLAFRKLAPGGVLAMETVNAVSPFVYTRSFYLDPTHTNPIHHEYLLFLVRQAGFDPVELHWRSPVEEEVQLATIDNPTAAQRGLVSEINRRITQLNQFLFCPQDYLVVARKADPGAAYHDSRSR